MKIINSDNNSNINLTFIVIAFWICLVLRGWIGALGIFAWDGQNVNHVEENAVVKYTSGFWKPDSFPNELTLANVFSLWDSASFMW